ncbi:MAG: pyrimidine dimer DNA glycosylase/endonuclease V [Gemmatimonadota bacterium]|nr:pyrimidine dimer DNA glycosylase/endonuclease V [Gemmatimonadota bacterium]
MRLWSIHPSFLDSKGIVAVWREGLLARAVLRGATKGYRHHSQLIRFREHPAPISAINHYLREIAVEAEARGYRFDRSRIGPVRDHTGMTVTTGQLVFELDHLRSKVARRASAELERLPESAEIRPHPLFVVRNGPIEPWERGTA